MATEEEIKLLSDKNTEQKLKQHDVCMKLSTLIRARLREEFKVKVPLSLTKRAEAKARYKMLTTNVIENRIRDLRKHYHYLKSLVHRFKLGAKNMRMLTCPMFDRKVICVICIV